MYVIFNSGNKRITARELFKIVHFGLQNTPPTFHRSVVKTSSNTGHTLDHTRFNKLLVENLVCVLESSVAMEDWLCIRIKTSRFIKCCENQFIVVTVSYLVCNNASVLKVKYCRKVEFLYLRTNLILKLRNVGKPFFKRNGRLEISVKYVL